MEVELYKSQEKMTIDVQKNNKNICNAKIFKARYRDYAENHTP